MLVLSRKASERIQIGDHISIAVVSIQGNKVRIGIEAPPSVSVRRGELTRDQEPARKPRRFLIVDDSLEDRQMYRRFLAQRNHPPFSFAETDTGEEGLALCRSEKPDCVLLDFRLPDIDGLEFLRQLRTENPSLPVIMLTGHGSPAVQDQAMKYGAADFLAKELSSDRLLQSVARAARLPKEWMN